MAVLVEKRVGHVGVLTSRNHDLSSSAPGLVATGGIGPTESRQHISPNDPECHRADLTAVGCFPQQVCIPLDVDAAGPNVENDISTGVILNGHDLRRSIANKPKRGNEYRENGVTTRS